MTLKFTATEEKKNILCSVPVFVWLGCVRGVLMNLVLDSV